MKAHVLALLVVVGALTVFVLAVAFAIAPTIIRALNALPR